MMSIYSDVLLGVYYCLTCYLYLSVLVIYFIKCYVLLVGYWWLSWFCCVCAFCYHDFVAWMYFVICIYTHGIHTHTRVYNIYTYIYIYIYIYIYTYILFIILLLGQCSISHNWTRNFWGRHHRPGKHIGYFKRSGPQFLQCRLARFTERDHT